MPAVSKAQQKFMGMVHAAQKGQKPASKAVAQAAQSIDPQDATDFASTKHKGLPAHKESYEANIHELVSRYNEYRNHFRQRSSMMELAEKLQQIAEMVEQTLMSESDDWFDGATIKRNVKEMKGYAGDFAKIAAEADVLQQRAQALYDDMGHVLGRYFEIREEIPDETGEEDYFSYTDEPSEEPVTNVNTEPAAPGAGQSVRNPTFDPDMVAEPGASEEDEEDTFAERAIALLRGRLTPEQLDRFNRLSEDKKVEMAWKLLK